MVSNVKPMYAIYVFYPPIGLSPHLHLHVLAISKFCVTVTLTEMCVDSISLSLAPQDTKSCRLMEMSFMIISLPPRFDIQITTNHLLSTTTD